MIDINIEVLSGDKILMMKTVTLTEAFIAKFSSKEQAISYKLASLDIVLNEEGV